ncbi:MAG: sigma-54-dependent Fis family transcriptional regulator [Nitrospinae bacterium]|nr:sigma-54-dependent Fis family transcriptional regulator [Nitrospinota bacterium]
MKKILVWLNDQTITASIRSNLESKFHVLSAFDKQEVEHKITQGADIIIFDYNLFMRDFIEILKKNKQLIETATFVHLIDPLSLEINRYNLVEPFDIYIEKPYRSEKLLKTIEKIESKPPKKSLIPFLKNLKAENTQKNIVAVSPQMIDTLEKVKAVSDTDITVLLEGETGTGKTRLAQIIHESGNRAKMPLVSINCSAIPQDLIESELFGIVKGAFTGATHDRKGKIEEAHGGTLLLDEIGDLPLSLQPKLLKVIEEKKWSPLGSNKTVKSNFRLICATNCNLKKKVADGMFREDLFYRIHVFPITIPTLRQRKDEIPFIAAHALDEVNRKYQKKIKGFSDDYMNFLIQSDWKGNIRELMNEIERSALLCKDEYLSKQKVKNSFAPHTFEANIQLKLNDFIEKVAGEAEKSYLTETLGKYKGRIGKAADHAGVNRKTFREKLKKHSINKQEYK